MNKYAIIDIGTNTILLLIVAFDENGNIEFIHHEERIPRIGKDVDESKNIGNTSFLKTAEIIKDYKKISDSFHIDKLVAVATSALRDANNKKEFVEFIYNETGVTIEIISGSDEAHWSYRGALSFLKVDPNQHYSVIDIGGGSTEIITGKGINVINNISLNIGAVRLTERYFRNNSPSLDEINHAKMFLHTEFEKLNSFKPICGSFIGVAGTITTLAMIDRGEQEITIDNINGYQLSFISISNILNDMKKLTANDIESKYFVKKGRSDIIFAGTLILHSFMEQFNITSIMTSINGLRYGIAIREFVSQTA
jgi:exopolyphosphatase/guanosine-5'-triphosphate,3'-diphosphate pyrophosphatase